ncbi:MAG TPA: IS1634 family transposase [Terriglobia bacterium]|jgi:transposase|nr:IS1634 family transposase [Terriglobia bacterium]
MYVATIPNRNSPPAILLRETFRQDGKVKNRTLANLSHWPRARIEALRRLLRGEFDQAADWASAPQLGPVFGLLFVLKQIAEALGIGRALGHSRLAKLGLFLVLARVAHQGSRLSAVRWAEDQAVAETLGLGKFDEDDLYAALEDLAARQARIEKALFRRYLTRRGQPPRLFLYDVTSSYLEGEQNALGAYGYNRDGKRGKLQIVIGLLADEEGEPLAVRVFEGNRSDPTTVVEQIKILQGQFGVQELVFVGDRGMVKSPGKQALSAAGLRYITALTDPQIRRLLSQGTLQLNLFSEQVCEVEAEGVRYILRKNESEARREQRRLEDKLAKLEAKMETRNEQVQTHRRCQPEAGQRAMAAWIERYKLTGLVEIKLEGTQLKLERKEEAIHKALELTGCYVVTTDVPRSDLSTQQVHDSYVSLEKVERDFRTLKAGLLEVRPVWVRKESRTRGHVFCCMLALKVSREMERRLRAAFGTTQTHADAITLPDALLSLARLCLLHYPVDEKTTLTKLPQPDSRQQEILQALGVCLPAM